MAEGLPLVLREPGPMGQEIRRFADSGLQDSINRALSGLDSDSKGAVIFHAGVDGLTVSTVFGKKDSRWTLVQSARRDWDGKWVGEAAVRFKFGD